MAITTFCVSFAGINPFVMRPGLIVFFVFLFSPCLHNSLKSKLKCVKDQVTDQEVGFSDAHVDGCGIRSLSLILGKLTSA